MPDLRRIVRVPRPGARPEVLLDLEADHAVMPGVRAARDTWRVESGQRQQQAVTRGGRYGGDRPTGERVGSGTVGATLRVTGSTMDDCLARAEELLAEVENARALGDVYMEWRPAAASRHLTTYYRLAGPGAARLAYSAVEAEALHAVGLEVTWPIVPRAFGAEMDVVEDWPGPAALDDWEVIGSGAPFVSGGDLHLASGNLTALRYVGRGYEYGDVEVTMRIRPTDVTGTETTGIRLKVLDTQNDFLLMRYQGEALIRAYVVDAGVETQIDTEVIAAWTPGTPYWLRARIEGNDLTIQHWTTDPELGGSAAAVDVHTLAGADLTKFGAGVTGGVAIQNNDVDVPIEEVVIRPFTWRGRTGPQRFEARGVPGNQDAEVTVEFASPPAASVYHFGMVAVDAGTDDPGAQPFGLHEAETFTGSGWTSTLVAGASGGSVMRRALSGSSSSLGSVRLTKTLEPWRLRRADDFDEASALIEVWMAAYVPTTIVSPRVAVTWVREGGTGHNAMLGDPNGVPLVLPTTSGIRRLYRVGMVLVDRLLAAGAGKPIELNLEWLYAAGSSGNLDVDYVLLTPPVRTALTPTGRPLTSSTIFSIYPSLHPAADGVKRILPNLSTTWRKRTDPPSDEARHGAMGGGSLALAPGDSSVLAAAYSRVPDDPTPSANHNEHGTVDLHLEVRPAWNLLRA